MSGLEIDQHEIIEAACIVTDSELNVIAEVRSKQEFFLLGTSHQTNQPILSSSLFSKNRSSSIKQRSRYQNLVHGHLIHTKRTG